MSTDSPPKVLIAEDDAFLRALLDGVLRPHFPGLKLVSNGFEAIAYLKANAVDVLMTDWMMPEMNGIELITRVRAECAEPPFIIMNTVLGSEEARAHALGSGADDFLSKPARPPDILRCINLGAQRRSASRRLARAPQQGHTQPSLPSDTEATPPHVAVAIAASTGGPAALRELFSEVTLPANCTYLVALHGPEWLHQSVAETLRRESQLKFALAEDGAIAEPGTVYFACKDRHLTVDRSARLKFDDSPPEHFLRPAADPMLRSVAQSYGRYAIAVVLTGMGHDGAAGCADIAAAGGKVLAQDPATAVIGTMPRAVIDAGLASEVLPLAQLGQAILRAVLPLNQALVKKRLARVAS